MNQTHRIVCWICLTTLSVTGLKYVPTFLVEQRKLDQQERIIDLKEVALLRSIRAPAPTVSMPVSAASEARAQLL